MKKIIAIMILTLFVFGCNRRQEKDGLDENNKLNINTSLITIIPYDTSSLHWVFKNYKPASLTNDDLKTIDGLLNICIAEYNIEQEKKINDFNAKNPDSKILRSNFIIDLSKYKRQYITATDLKGEKQVWVNCFCDNWDTNSRKNPLIVMDGGNCYFNLKINLTTEKYYSLIVNIEV